MVQRWPSPGAHPPKMHLAPAAASPRSRLHSRSGRASARNSACASASGSARAWRNRCAARGPATSTRISMPTFWASPCLAVFAQRHQRPWGPVCGGVTSLLPPNPCTWDPIPGTDAGRESVPRQRPPVPGIATRCQLMRVCGCVHAPPSFCSLPGPCSCHQGHGALPGGGPVDVNKSSPSRLL